MRIKTGDGKVEVTDEYGKTMYETALTPGMQMFVGGATQVQLTVAGQLLYEMGLGAGAHPPPGAGPSPLPPLGGEYPPETAPPAGGGSPPPPIDGGEIPWPASGQVVYHVPMQPFQTVRYTMRWKSKMDPAKFGFIKVDQEPGSAVMVRNLKLSNNGALKFDSTPYGDTGPTGNLCNAPTPPPDLSTVQMNYDDVLGIEVTNGDNTSGQPSNMLLDIATPDRY